MKTITTPLLISIFISEFTICCTTVVCMEICQCNIRWVTAAALKRSLIIWLLISSDYLHSAQIIFYTCSNLPSNMSDSTLWLMTPVRCQSPSHHVMCQMTFCLAAIGLINNMLIIFKTQTAEKGMNKKDMENTFTYKARHFWPLLTNIVVCFLGQKDIKNVKKKHYHTLSFLCLLLKMYSGGRNLQIHLLLCAVWLFYAVIMNIPVMDLEHHQNSH